MLAVIEHIAKLFIYNLDQQYLSDQIWQDS